MNPLTNVKNITKLNELELSRGTVDKKSWHDMYKDSAWIFIGGLSYGLTEGDILSVFSQYGEIVNINLIRDAKTGKIKGFCFLCYANQKSTVLAVDNFNGIKLCGRTIRVDHVSNYKPPKEHENDDELTKQLKNEGCAPKPIKLENAESPIASGVTTEKKKSKKVKKEKKKHKKKRKHDSNKEETHNYKKIKVKEEKIDPGYTKNELPVREKDPKRKNKRKATSDSETDSSESDSSDSDSQLMPRKDKSSRNYKTKHSEQSYKEKQDNHNPRSRISNDGDGHKRSEISQKERDLSSSFSHHKSHKQKRFQDDDYLNDSSSKSKSHRLSARDRRESQSDDDHYKDYSDSHKNKHSSEYIKSDFKHQRNYSASSSESDISEKPKSRVQDIQNEEHKRSHYKHDEERYSKSQNRHESSPHHRDHKRNERKSRHERDH